MTAAPYSVLFGEHRPADVDRTPEPAYFTDLRLDQVVAALAGPKDEFGLTPLYRALVADPAVLTLRQDVFDDVARERVRAALDDFSTAMATVHNWLRASANLRVPAQRDRWHLNAAAAYCGAVHALGHALTETDVRSAGLRAIAEHVTRLADSAPFRALESEASALEQRLSGLSYAVLLQGAKVTVGGYDGEPDYGEYVVGLFSRFQQDRHAAEEERQEQQRRRKVQYAGGDPVRERIIALVAELHPDLFEELAGFRERHPEFLDPTVSLFHREVQFYLRYDDLAGRLDKSGMPTARAVLRDTPGLVARDAYDLALAVQHLDEEQTGIVGNDLELSADERRVVVTGPNQGGKTTLSRTVGQLHHLAGIGCPVPAGAAEIRPPDRIFSHFEREELGHETGKLEDDLLRIRTILDEATGDSVVVLNEIFASTTTADAVELARGVLDRLGESGALTVCVTFLDEIAQLPGTVTLVAQVDPGDVTRRTFRVVRAPADGRAYATALAVKHGLTYDDLRGRIR